MWFSFFSRISCVKPFHYFFPEDKIYFSCVKLNKNDIFFLSWIFIFFLSLDVTHEKKDLKKKGLFRIIFHVWKQVNLFFFFFKIMWPIKTVSVYLPGKNVSLFLSCAKPAKMSLFYSFQGYFILFFFCKNVFFHLLRHMNNSSWINLMYNFLLSKHIFK